MAKAPAEQISAPITDPAALPARVAAMRAKILDAAGSGELERLRIPVEWNELPPIFERGLKKGPGFDPLAVLKTRSFDGEGREMLAILKAVLEEPCIRAKRGPFETFVWPALALAPPRDPDPQARIAALRCQRFADLGLSPPRVHMVRIGADAVWHSFMPEV
jgi:hypothetical protein